MKRRHLSVVMAITVLVIASCTGKNSDSGVNASRNTSVAGSEAVLNEQLQKKIGAWVKPGVECYGIVVGYFSDGSTIGKPVKCKVMTVKPDKVKLKTIESVSLLEGEGCDKMGLAYGDTWWEEEGDLFKTLDEADTYLKEKGWKRR